MKLTIFAIGVVLLMFTVPALAADTTLVESPDKQVQFRLFLLENQLGYRVNFRNSPVIDNSILSFSIDNKVITRGAKAGAPKAYTISEKYPWTGAHDQALNECNGVVIPVRHKEADYKLEVRVFNNGVAFRVIVPAPKNITRVPDEATVFNIPAGSTIWYHDMTNHYESVHAQKAISNLQAGEWVAPPGTIKLPNGCYAAVTEADLKAYPGISLQANGKNGLVTKLPQHQRASYPYRLRYSPEDTLRLQQPAAITGTITTPWRVVLVGADLNAMVNNDVVANLCPPPDPALFPQGLHTDWIKPGRAVWKYLDGGGQGTPEVMKTFTDGAAALGFEHNILEGFWSRWTDDQIRDLINYSKQKKVGIWFWEHSKTLRDPVKRLAFFKRCHELGVTGAKIDFFDHEAKETIDLYDAILREAAEYKILLDFHGANKPTGLARTWPNEFVREAVKGMETRRIEDKAKHEVTIPFTRWLAGPAEYTVVMFGERRGNTTWAHQVASAAIMHAPLLTYAAHPDSLLANPAVEIIKSIPATWDETIVLPGSEIGQVAMYARRKGKTWFLAIMNGSLPVVGRIALNFLKAGNYAAIVAKDNPGNPASIQVSNATYTAADIIELSLEAGGGYIARFTEK